MKRKDLYMYMDALSNVTELRGVKFAYTLIKNKKKIEEEIKILEEVVKASDDFSIYENERIRLCEIYCEKDDNGKPVILENKYKILNVENFDNELNSLKEKHMSSILERERQINEYNKMLEEDIDINLSKIDFIDIPIDITTTQLESIEFMVNFD